MVAVVVLCLCAVLALWAGGLFLRLRALDRRVCVGAEALRRALDNRAEVAASVEPSLQEHAQAVTAVKMEARNVEPRLEAEEKFTTAVLNSEVRELPAVLEAWHQVALACRVYNDAVADSRALRLRPLLRPVGCGQSARLPKFFDLSALGHAH